MAKRIQVTSVRNEGVLKGLEKGLEKEIRSKFDPSIVRAGLKLNYKPNDPFGQVLQYTNSRAKEVYTRARRDYWKMLMGIQGFLDAGIQVSNSQLSDPSKKLGYTAGIGDIKLSSGRLTPAPWKGLPKDYIAIRGYRRGRVGEILDPRGIWAGLPKPRGRPVFWNKTGRLAAAYRAWLGSYRSMLSPESFGYSLGQTQFFDEIGSFERAEQGAKGAGKTTRSANTKFSLNRMGSIATGGRGRTLYSIKFKINPPPSRVPAIDTLLASSFISTRPGMFKVPASKLGKRGAAPTDISRIAYPEFRRPILSRYAAQAGKKYREDLANFLKNR